MQCILLQCCFNGHASTITKENWLATLSFHLFIVF